MIQLSNFVLTVNSLEGRLRQQITTDSYLDLKSKFTYYASQRENWTFILKRAMNNETNRK